MSVFDPREVECEPITEVIDEGTYVVEIAKAFYREDNFGQKLRVFYKQISPEPSLTPDGKKRDVFIMENFNLDHGKPSVAIMGRQQFKKLLMCIGMADSPLDSYEDIEGKQLKVTVEIEPHYKKQGSQQNKLSDHRPVSAIDVNNMKAQSPPKNDDIPY